MVNAIFGTENLTSAGGIWVSLRRLINAALILGPLVAASGAQATVIAKSFSGFIGPSPTFSPSGSVLGGVSSSNFHVGDPVSGSFSYDTALFSHSTNVVYDTYKGTSLISIQATINGFSFSSHTPNSSTAWLANHGCCFATTDYYQLDTNPTGNYEIGIYGSAPIGTLYTDPSDLASVAFSNTTDLGLYLQDNALSRYWNIQIVNPTVTAAPEPSTVSLLLAGLVSAGGFRRLRRKKVTAAQR